MAEYGKDVINDNAERAHWTRVVHSLLQSCLQLTEREGGRTRGCSSLMHDALSTIVHIIHLLKRPPLLLVEWVHPTAYVSVIYLY